MIRQKSIPALISRKVARRRQAFTLMELLVAMTVLALLLVMLMSMVDGATRLWKTNENRVDSYREARSAINLIASDLTSLYPSTNLSFFYTQEDSNIVSCPVKIPNMDGALFFLTALPNAAQETGKNKSDLCTVGYFLGYDKTSLTSKGTPSYNLYRYFRSSDETFTKGLSNGDILNEVKIDTSPTGGSNSEVLAKNITGFTVVPYEIPTSDPNNPGSSQAPIPFKKTAQTPLPDMLEVTVKSISNETAKRFGSNKADWENTNSLTRKQNDRTFTTRIYLHGAAQVKASAQPPGPPPPGWP